MKKFKNLALKISIYAFVAIVIGGGAWWGYKLYKKTSEVEGEIEKVFVSKGKIEVKFNDIGEVFPKSILDVNSKVGGSIEELFVMEGKKVKKGDKLAIVQPGQSAADKFIPIDVLAPISGTVMRCVSSGYYSEATMAKVGQRITGANSSNPTCLMRIGNYNKMLVKLKVSEMEVFKLRVGMPVKIFVDALGNEVFPGKISMIAPQANKDNRSGIKTFRVEAAINKYHKLLRPGITARVEAIMDSKKDILIMPLTGLFEKYGATFAYLYVLGDKAKKVSIKTGLRGVRNIEILSGLKEKDEVYTDKPLNLAVAP
ncbi:MAG: efflux RND transporter periplasmic adaptor subunit [Elusimicrobiales bacterium]|nr:efflux RND transporter periplasmic adaptor subunit [Elusimicrobiales bacterium]